MSEVIKAEQESSGALISVIERVAMSPDADIEKLERMLAMQERIYDRDAKTFFAQSMSIAQSGMGRVSADAVNPQTRSKYASYGALDKAIRPTYTANGFALSFNTADSPVENCVRVMCEVSHINGHLREYHIDMPADGKGAKGGDVMTKTHATGAAVSYGMRYLLKMIFNVAIGEDDVDGNRPIEVITLEQVATLIALAEEVKADMPKLMIYLKVESLSELPSDQYDHAVKAMEAKRK